MNQLWQQFVDALPASGMVPHSDFLVTLAERGLTKVNHDIWNIKKAGLIDVENQRNEAGELVLMIGRAVSGGAE